jgi:hypothetical protein
LNVDLPAYRILPLVLKGQKKIARGSSGAEFLAAGSASTFGVGRILSSDGGAIWKMTDFPDVPEPFVSVASGNGIALAVSYSGMGRYSLDNAEWKIATLPKPVSRIVGAAFFAEKFFLADESGNVFSSSDLQEWTTNSVTTNFTVSLTATGDRLYLLGTDPAIFADYPGFVSYTKDGVSWESPAQKFRGRAMLIASGNGITLLQTTVPGSQSQDSRPIIYRSNDNGQSWNEDTQNAFSNVSDLRFEKGWFIALVNDDTILRSTDAVNWTETHLSRDFHPRATALAGNRIVVIGAGGILTSPDLSIPCLTPPDTQALAMTFFGNTGEQYKIEASGDLRTWKTYTNFVAAASEQNVPLSENPKEQKALFFRVESDQGAQ